MFSYLSGIRVSRLLLLLILLLLIIIPLLVHHALSSVSDLEQSSPGGGGGPGGPMVDNADLARKTLGLVDFTHLSGPELHHRIQELLRIKESVQSELRLLESKRNEMQLQISAFHRKIEELRDEATKDQTELERLRVSIGQARLALVEYTKRNTPEVRAPLSLPSVISHSLSMPPPRDASSCSSMALCFDYSRCALSSGFPIYVYDHDRFSSRGLLSDIHSLTFSPDKACVFVAFVDHSDGGEPLNPKTLSHWNGDGRNHLIIHLGQDGGGPPQPQESHRALILKSDFNFRHFRPRFDLVLPQLPSERSIAVWEVAPTMLPIHKKFLISFVGVRPAKDAAQVMQKVIEVVRQISGDQTDDQSYVDVDCKTDPDVKITYSPSEWQLCGTELSRKTVLVQSTFTLIIMSPDDGDIVSSSGLQRRLSEAMKSGSIPVILGASHEHLLLPYQEVIDWRKAVVLEPLSRLPELHFLLRSFPDADLFQMQRQLNLIWKGYFSTGSAVISSALSVIRDRIHLPPPPVEDDPSPSVFTESNPRMMLDQLPADLEPGEPLGPLEQTKPADAFRRNFSSVYGDRYSRWNNRFDPFVLPPYTPWEPLLPTDAKFLGSHSGFRPINEGEGGSGREFSQAIGGNSQTEQFTVVMLTYEREQVLVDSLIRLYGLPYLNKVIVVWNSEDPPSNELRWPNIGVPIEVIRTEKNSLNNRFKPFDAIETEAILSVDDDAHLRHDEIIFGFRVWRENRDRLVGFPGRFHAWDVDHNVWNYNSNYSCELSMVLTGAAFYHKYYNYAYSQVMPVAIRDKVDEFMNCEDLAMNFLISHITRKPPVKVTSRWTFRCPGCPVSLSEDDSHFQERHKCINFFSKVFGYMPLLYTQFRADSVLFKTRIPQDKQKCFKFI